MNTKTTIATKANKDAQAVETALTIEWEGMTEEDVRALAQQALIVKLQANLRKAETIPTELEINATDYKVGSRQAAAPKKIDPSKMTDEEKRALIERLQASLAA